MATEKSEEPTVFVVEDEPAVRESLTMVVESWGLRVEAFASAKEFLARHDASRRGCLVLDVHLSDTSGVELHERLVRAGTCIPTIFVTGHAPPGMSEESRERGVVAVFEKPCPPDALLAAIRKALHEA